MITTTSGTRVVLGELPLDIRLPRSGAGWGGQLRELTARQFAPKLWISQFGELGADGVFSPDATQDTQSGQRE